MKLARERKPMNEEMLTLVWATVATVVIFTVLIVIGLMMSYMEGYYARLPRGGPLKEIPGMRELPAEFGFDPEWAKGDLIDLGESGRVSLEPLLKVVRLLRGPVSLAGFGGFVMLPLAIFGPVGGVRFWVVAATISFLWWWGNMRFITGWGEGRPLMSRRGRLAVSLCLAGGLCSWAFTIHPNPDRLNQLMFATCCITVVLLFWRGWANRWFPIQGAQPIVVQAPV